MTDGAPRLYYLDDIPTPYRLGVHRRAAECWPGPFKIAYCAGSEPGRDWSFDFDGLDVEILPGMQYRPRRQVNPFTYKFNPGVLRSLETFRPDVVAMSGYVHPTVFLAALWCRRNGVPYGIANESSKRSSTSSGLRWSLKRLISGRLVHGMTFGLPVGAEAGDYLRALGSTDAPMFFFPNTPDTSLIAAEARRVLQSGAEGEIRGRYDLGPAPIVLFVGRLIDAKRPMDALAAFRSLEGVDAKLVFVGDGPLRGALEAAAEGDERIVFTGWLSEPAELAALMAVSAMLVLPSQHEPWGAVVNEAMAAGTPVVASDRVGAAVELIETGVNGMVVKLGRIDLLAEAMRLLATDRQVCLRMGKAAQDTALAQGHEFAASNLVAGAKHALTVRARS